MTRRLGLMVITLGLAGCSLDGLLKSGVLPPDVTDPAITQTPAGALAAYHGTIAQFRNAFGGEGVSAVAITGLLSDELQGQGVLGGGPEDQRDLPEVSAVTYISGSTYSLLQKVRGQASQTIGLLTQYRPEEPALAGHVYALAGYAEVILAELFCSGIPLSTLDYKGDYTYRPGSTTAEVFTHAAALFDTALILTGDSTWVRDLARVGQARALLALGQYPAAAAVVAAVPDAYSYALTYTAAITTTDRGPNFATTHGDWRFSVPDREGVNGLDWRSSGDPRTPTTNISGTWHPDHYAEDGSSPIVLASGVEARLVEAEAALQAGDAATWRATLNALRTDGTYDTQPNAQDPTQTDTLWHAGSGGYAGLAPLSDPGTAEGRVDLLFRERGFWLFLTGHRQGDLRRLIRQYGRTERQVYPVGIYGSSGVYGVDVTAPIPASERVLNAQFTGCLSRQA